MIKGIFLHYLPYGVIDVILTLVVITEILANRWDLLWSNVPLLILGILSLNRIIKKEASESDA